MRKITHSKDAKAKREILEERVGRGKKQGHIVQYLVTVQKTRSIYNNQNKTKHRKAKKISTIQKATTKTKETTQDKLLPTEESQYFLPKKIFQTAMECKKTKR